MQNADFLHIPMSNFAHGLSETRVVFRLRARHGVLKTCTLCYGDTACRQNPVVLTDVPMELVAVDADFDWYEAEFETPYPRICYCFRLCDGQETQYYYEDFLHDAVTEERNALYKLPFVRLEDVADAPDWLKNAVIYNIFPDSFTDGSPVATQNKDFQGLPVHAKHGGTLQNIRRHLDDMQKLGCNCIYLNPIFAAGEYHKYDVIDYYHIDPCFGTNADFRCLVDDCHERDMKVIIDGVFNHSGWRFFAFEDVVQNGKASPYWHWFYDLTEPVVRPTDSDTIPNYACFGYERLMPKLNTGNPEVQRYFCDVCRYWIEEYDIDGWRLDVADEINHAFWRAFRKTAKEAKPSVALIGEVWQTASTWLDGSMFDSCMNYDFWKHCRAFFAEETIDAAAFDAHINHMRMRYRKNLVPAQMNPLDTHDVPRFLTFCGGDWRKQRLAILFQMTCIGAPSVFYGDEKGFAGRTEDEYRQPMCFTDGGETEAFYRAAIALRNAEPALRTGEYRSVIARDRLYVFSRSLDDTRITVALNAGEHGDALPAVPSTAELLLSAGWKDGRIQPYGFAVWKEQ